VSPGAPWAISFERRTEKDLHRLDEQVGQRVIAALDRLLARDPSVDVRRLQGNDEWRLRVGDWRVRLRLDFDNNTSSSCASCLAAERTNADCAVSASNGLRARESSKKWRQPCSASFPAELTASPHTCSAVFCTPSGGCD